MLSTKSLASHLTHRTHRTTVIDSQEKARFSRDRTSVNDLQSNKSRLMMHLEWAHQLICTMQCRSGNCMLISQESGLPYRVSQTLSFELHWFKPFFEGDLLTARQAAITARFLPGSCSIWMIQWFRGRSSIQRGKGWLVGSDGERGGWPTSACTPVVVNICMNKF